MWATMAAATGQWQLYRLWLDFLKRNKRKLSSRDKSTLVCDFLEIISVWLFPLMLFSHSTSGEKPMVVVIYQELCKETAVFCHLLAVIKWPLLYWSLYRISNFQISKKYLWKKIVKNWFLTEFLTILNRHIRSLQIQRWIVAEEK